MISWYGSGVRSMKSSVSLSGVSSDRHMLCLADGQGTEAYGESRWHHCDLPGSERKTCVFALKDQGRKATSGTAESGHRQMGIMACHLC